ncbi:unnamed protein product, partial [Mesorhabditis belari]|uniref:EGF-like domain-containing protein n=1 Tax=Mesorhabditis belari TaxID=2138241 RepID=A0AAF3F8U1_9BILA
MVEYIFVVLAFLDVCTDANFLHIPHCVDSTVELVVFRCLFNFLYVNTCNTGNPCKNGAACVMLYSGKQVYCNCTAGWQGANCDVATLTPNDKYMNCTKIDWSKESSSSNNCTKVTNSNYPSLSL